MLLERLLVTPFRDTPQIGGLYNGEASVADGAVRSPIKLLYKLSCELKDKIP